MNKKNLPQNNFSKKKDKALNSLREVECFLNRTTQCIKINGIANFIKKK